MKKIFNGKPYNCKHIKGTKAIRCSPVRKPKHHSGRKSGSGKLKRTRGARMVAAKKRAAKHPGGKGPVRNRPAGRKIMKH